METVKVKVKVKVKVYQLNEYDGVSAESLEQARAWYLEITGLSEYDAFDDFEPTELPLSYEIYEDETRARKQPLSEVIEESWKGEPFLAFSSD